MKMRKSNEAVYAKSSRLHRIIHSISICALPNITSTMADFSPHFAF
jgi:hypothetical protein